MVSRLVFDGTSPLYRDGAISLRYAVRSVRLALDPIEVQAPELWAAWHRGITRVGRPAAPR